MNVPNMIKSSIIYYLDISVCLSQERIYNYMRYSSNDYYSIVVIPIDRSSNKKDTFSYTVDLPSLPAKTLFALEQ